MIPDIFSQTFTPKFPVDTQVHFWLSEPENPWCVVGIGEYDDALVYLLQNDHGTRARSFESYLEAYGS